MRLILLTSLVMVAFAANSVLNRAALTDAAMPALSFALIRTASGALALAAMVMLRDHKLELRGPHRWAGVASLSLYMVAFSMAYLSLDAGVGALILFGGVQVTMFLGALFAREPVPFVRWIGAGLAFAGLVWLLWPAGAFSISPLHGLVMCGAAFGWGIYSLAGRVSGEPLKATAANFILATPICLIAVLVIPLSAGEDTTLSGQGIILAVISGVVTSAMGYALWYTVLPRLSASVAAVAQLTVPVIVLAGGILFLSETVTTRFAFASILVLGGVAVSILGPAWRQRTNGSKAS